MSVITHLISTVEKNGAAYVVLIDPDRNDENTIQDRVLKANESGVDALFVGGSLMMDTKCVERVKLIKSCSNIPVIFFPGGVGQLNPYYDAMLFMSIISGRNPHYLIGEQVIAAPLVKDMGVETIPTGYILIDGGAGSDTAVFGDTYESYTLTYNDDGSLTVKHNPSSSDQTNEGIDTLTNIEKLQFSDLTTSAIQSKYSLSSELDSSKNVLEPFSETSRSGTLNFSSGG